MSIGERGNMGDDLVTGVKKEKGGATIEINGDVTLWLNRDIWLERPLAEGESIDLQSFQKWLLPRQYPEALNYAVSLLAIRARSSGELRQKMKRKHYMDDTIEMALYKLETEHLLDDEAFAREWAETLSLRQMGKHRIMQELRLKGIDTEIAQRALAGLDSEQGNEAAVLMAHKLVMRHANEPDTRKAMNKIMAAMARRGYGYEEARNAVAEAMRRLEDEDE